MKISNLEQPWKYIWNLQELYALQQQMLVNLAMRCSSQLSMF